jgi:hypothetical protein
MALHQRPDRDRAEIVGAHLRQRAAVTAERGTDGIANKRFILHGFSRQVFGWIAQIRPGNILRRPFTEKFETSLSIVT